MFQRDLLKDRAIFLTGGGTGLGRSMALRFAELGARLFLIGRREDPLRETCEEILRFGGAAAYATCDVRDYHAVEERLLGAVQAVFADYREDMERQHRQLERTLSSNLGHGLQPKSWLRLTSSGLEAVVRYPVDLQHATEIDDRVTRELLKEIEREPKLNLIGSAHSAMKVTTDLTSDVPS